MKNSYRIITALATILFCTFAYADKLDSLILNKTATPNGDGTYTLKLDTYVIGDYSEETQVIKTTNPVDFVLCLDVSGSMDDPLPNSPELASKNNGTSSSFRNSDNLDKEKGKQEGYYAAKVSFTSAYRQVRWNGSKWQYHNDSFNAWMNIEGSIYQIHVFKSKLGALVDGCDAFLNKIEASQQEGSLNGSNGHKVGIVTYADGAKQVLGLTSINNKSTISYSIDTLKTGGSTYADEGLKTGKDMLSLNDNGNGRSKVLVLFTDGEPNHGSGFSTTVANTCISVANDIKSKNAMVFTINVLETSEGTNMWKYMNYVSSNYPNATSLTNSGEKKSDKYYHLATNESALNAAFEAVVTESLSKSGGAGIELNVSQTTIRDIVTPSFVLPKNASGDYKIKVYEVPVNTSASVPSSHAIEDIPFVTVSEADKNVRPANVSVDIVVDESTGKSTLDVRGFDFSAKWIGYKHLKKGNSENWTLNAGSKLVIEIIIAPNPEVDGGRVETNDPASGVYVGDVNIVSPTKEYPVPTVYTPKNLIIKTSSLEEGKGESMIFRVTSSGDPSFQMTIALTEGEELTQVIAQLPVKDSNNNDITYTVTPVNSWAWAYGDVNPITHNLLENNVFEFTAVSSGSAKKHAEDSKNNVFEKR